MNLLTLILVLLYLLACVILIFFILIQSGKGGGLSSLGAASQGISDAFGTTGAERALNKLTTYAAVGYIVLAIALTIVGTFQSTGSKSILGKPATTAPANTAAPGAAPAGIPAGAGQQAPVMPAQPAAPAQGAPAQGK